jgi:hypothetical protein
MPCFAAIQTTLNPFTTKSVCLTIGWIIDRHRVAIKKTGLRSIGLLLFQILNAISLAQTFQFVSQLTMRYLNKVLIVLFANIDPLFPFFIAANNQFTDAFHDTVIDNEARGFIEIVSEIVIAIVEQAKLSFGKFVNLLFSFDRLESGILFVVPLVNCFKWLAVNDKRRPSGIKAGYQIFHTKIDREGFFRQILSRLCLNFTNKFYSKYCPLCFGLILTSRKNSLRNRGGKGMRIELRSGCCLLNSLERGNTSLPFLMLMALVDRKSG